MLLVIPGACKCKERPAAVCIALHAVWNGLYAIMGGAYTGGLYYAMQQVCPYMVNRGGAIRHSMELME